MTTMLNSPAFSIDEPMAVEEDPCHFVVQKWLLKNIGSDGILKTMVDKLDEKLLKAKTVSFNYIWHKME